ILKGHAKFDIHSQAGATNISRDRTPSRSAGWDSANVVLEVGILFQHHHGLVALCGFYSRVRQPCFRGYEFWLVPHQTARRLASPAYALATRLARNGVLPC